jgi:hypothetical protein
VRWSLSAPAGTSPSTPTRCCTTTACPTALGCSPPTAGVAGQHPPARCRPRRGRSRPADDRPPRGRTRRVRHRAGPQRASPVRLQRTPATVRNRLADRGGDLGRARRRAPLHRLPPGGPLHRPGHHITESDGKRARGHLARQGAPVLRWALHEPGHGRRPPHLPRPRRLPRGSGNALAASAPRCRWRASSPARPTTPCASSATRRWSPPSSPPPPEPAGIVRAWAPGSLLWCGQLPDAPAATRWSWTACIELLAEPDQRGDVARGDPGVAVPAWPPGATGPCTVDPWAGP